MMRRSRRSCWPTKRNAPSTSCWSISAAQRYRPRLPVRLDSRARVHGVERYSHVMHIVSQVEGAIAPGQSAYDLMRATFPAGTVNGRPEDSGHADHAAPGTFAARLLRRRARLFLATTATWTPASCCGPRSLKDGQIHIQGRRRHCGGLRARLRVSGDHWQGLRAAEGRGNG